jgi:predicted RNase H-like HicB family nuclease
MAQLAEWPAVVTCGRTVEETREMLLDAAREMIASYREEGREPPIGGGHVERVTIDPRRRLKRRELKRHVAEHGCEVVRGGSRHTIWGHPPADLRAPGLPAPRDPSRYRPRDLPPTRGSTATRPPLRHNSLGTVHGRSQQHPRPRGSRRLETSSAVA